ncbi:oxygen-independent coproporphyrinogen-3 oxidase [Pseudochrobactrum saccharolyticum]|uniref:Coproporphyrinogen-III oxidase n=1 Tax=Pseudochrobactrum saccharolyticum TaxID=354352 RepID=A0A7W8ALR9_9HYPH|nr:oxygen-independent coproporphyrinogen III oxidase [Pseudochrobactrum saccharolyticum]KAB0540004.1 oxygen-independent coproporphyrinogen III oxidase [Pseudochrobactrum saccharolyticum]MBB5092630.1 oxygen-independent coproporphyrinogen-3 oxidase [Pseudochrobactrum saccharolyticum]
MTEIAARHYASLAVPRYTSYPTAADFSPAVGKDQYEAWLRRLRQGEPVSLYLHVPYCRDLCHYCGCHAKIARRDTVIEAYADILIREIRQAGQYLTERPKAVHLHWGGGTPSILGGEGIARITQVLREQFDFADDMEHAIELDPRKVDKKLCRDLAQVGVNRASLGVQDLNADVQQAIGRVQPIEQVESAVNSLWQVGITSLNFDLIYGLPLQTVATLRETCKRVAAFRPSRIACYGYAHLPARRANQRLIDTSLLPDADARFEQAQIVGETFMAMGYEPVGIDHYALPSDALAVAAKAGQLRRNFQGYTDDDCPTLLGFGASSISQFREGYTQNVADIGQYKAAVLSERAPVTRGYAFNDSDRLRAKIIEKLMCDFRVDLNDIAAGVNFSDELALLRPLAADGIVTVQGSVIVMAPEHHSLVRLVAAVFDEFRKECAHSFSMAI